MHEPALSPVVLENRKACNKPIPTALKKARTALDFELTGSLFKKIKAAAIALPEAALTCKHLVAVFKMAARVDSYSTKERPYQCNRKLLSAAR